MKFVDIHAHLQFPQFDADREAVIRRLAEAGIGVINVGTDLASSQGAIALAEKHENKHAIFADSVRRGFLIGTCLSLVLLLKYLSLFTFPTLLLLILLIASLEYTITQHLIGFKSPKTQKTPEDMLQSVP